MHRLKSWQLFAICVLVWGTTWYAITFQIGHTAPEVGVALRFAVAGASVLAFGAARGLRLRFAPGDHAALALQGFFMYGVSYLCVYYAERSVASGLVAVGYSASPLVAGLGGHALLGLRVSRRFVVGGLMGLAGVLLMFWPEFGKAAASQDVVLGLAFTVGAVLLSSAGSLIATERADCHSGLHWDSGCCTALRPPCSSRCCRQSVSRCRRPCRGGCRCSIWHSPGRC
jgi:drug/metabolite transporter (DMT)-like permease